MLERQLIELSDAPVTISNITDGLKSLNIEQGETVIVHTSMSKLGWVSGGAPTVVDALQRVISPSGNIVMPTHTGQYADPALWGNPPVPEDWVDEIRASLPPYRPAITPTRNMGEVPECFRNYPDVERSQHPVRSFAAWGNDASQIVDDHGIPYGHDDNSPLAEIYELDGSVVLLGVSHESNTSLHLAEHRADFDKEVRTNGAPVSDNKKRKWISFPELVYPDDNPAQRVAVAETFEKKFPGKVTRGTVGDASACVVPQRELVDFAVQWYESRRQ